MSAKCAKLIAKWLIEHEAIPSEDYELYVYAAHSLIMTLAPFGMALVIGMLIGRAKTAVTIILPFMVIRKFSGGYHADKAWVCVVSSSLILSGCACVAEHLTYHYGVIGAMLMASVSLVIHSPIESGNRRLDAHECRVYQKITIGLVTFVVLASLICYWCGMENLAIGVILTGGLQIPCLWIKFIK